MDSFVQIYGDMLFDLCESMLSTSTHAQAAFRLIVKKLHAESKNQKYVNYERPWVLRITCDRLLAIYPHEGRRVSPSEQIRLDANENVTTRLQHFGSYFHRLRPEDQLILLLRDKHAIPLSEVAIALAIPEGSLKIRRQLSLKHLEEWLWNAK